MKNKLNKSVTTLLLISGLTLIMSSANASGRVKVKGVKSNSSGGATSVRGSAARGQNGGGFAHARGTTTNGQGQAVGGGATVVKGPNGGGGVRGGSFNADNNGNVNYQGGAAATGANGSAATTGGFSRSEGGGLKGSRSTTATANNGNTYNGNTTYQSGSGINHSQTCYNASGYEIKCPKK